MAGNGWRKTKFLGNESDTSGIPANYFGLIPIYRFDFFFTSFENYVIFLRC